MSDFGAAERAQVSAYLTSSLGDSRVSVPETTLKDTEWAKMQAQELDKPGSSFQLHLDDICSPE